MHEFVEPPRLGRVVVSLFVASWEIECCAPPPTVGEWTSWPVFVFLDDHPGPGVVEYGIQAADRAGCVLVDDVVVAYWDESRWGPRPESARVPAELCGTVHGGTVPDDVPPVEGRVDRVRVVREQYRRIGESGGWEPVPGTATATTDVRESPRRFSSMPTRVGEPTETGVLVDVRLPAASLPALRPST